MTFLKRFVFLLMLLLGLGFAQPVQADVSPEFLAQLKQALHENPGLILEVLQNNSETVLDIVQQGSDKRINQALVRQWQEDIKQPKTVDLAGRPARGPEKADITLVAFSDFTCSYCQQAAFTVENLLRRYPEQIRFVFKQIPNADAGRLASQWFLAGMSQNPEKAWQFYALMFDGQARYLADPMAVLREMAAKAGLDVKQLEADLKTQGKAIDAIIDADIAEAKAMGFHGTPYFLVNNLVIRGALPLENFIDAVEFARNAGK